MLYEGRRGDADLDGFRTGASILAPYAQPVIEGIVIKPIVEQASYMGRKVLKHINDEYLLKNQSDNH